MRPRGDGESSINSIASIYYMIKVTIAFLIGRVDRAPVHAGSVHPGPGELSTR